MNYFSTLTRMLRDRDRFLQEIREGRRLRRKIVALFVVSVIFFALYGAIIGASSHWMQAVASAIKLPILYLTTPIICLPTLYFFNLLFGSRRRIGQYFALLTIALAAISVLLFSLAPVVLFFLLSGVGYPFFKLLNVAIFIGTGAIGLRFFYQSMQTSAEDELVGQKIRDRVLLAWLFLYALVGSQLGWILRPVFGDPATPFILFSQEQGNLYSDIVQAILEIIGFPNF